MSEADRFVSGFLGKNAPQAIGGFGLVMLEAASSILRPLSLNRGRKREGLPCVFPAPFNASPAAISGPTPCGGMTCHPPLLRNELSASLIHVLCIAPDTLKRFFCDHLANIGSLFAKLCDMFKKSADSSYTV